MANVRVILFTMIIIILQASVSAQDIDSTQIFKVKAEPSVKLRLIDAIRITLKNNVGIAVQDYISKIRTQEIEKEEAVFDPSLSAEISTNRRDSQVASAFAVPNISQNENDNWKLSVTQKLRSGADYEINFTNRKNNTNSAFAGLNPQYNSELSLTVTQPLLKNFGFSINESNIYIANNNREISNHEFQDKVIKTLATVENNYWDLVFSIKDLNVKKKSLERARDLERRVRAQVKVGTLAPIEILQAQSEVASREQLLVSATDLIKDNEDRLKNEMNINFRLEDANRPLEPIDKPQFENDLEISFEKGITTALDNRPDYMAKKKDLENKNIRLKFNENQIYPSLDLFATLGLNGIAGDAKIINQFNGGTSKSAFDGDYLDTLENVIDPEFYNFEVGIKLSYPLGNRSAKSKLTAARLELERSILDIKNLERLIIVQVREAVRQVKTDIKRVEAARVALRLSEEKLKAEEKKFSVGMSTSFNILEFQEDVAEEQSNNIKAIIDYRKSKNNLNRVMAVTIDHHNIQFAKPDTGK